MENIFLRIKTVYDKDSNRTLDNLSSIYNKPEFLRKNLEEILNVNNIQHYFTGKKVLIKPNWVIHTTNPKNDICLRTNNNFLLILLDIILSYKPSSITIGDAPIQGCIWNKVVNEQLLTKIKTLESISKIPVQIIDFRRRTYSILNNNPKLNIRPLSNYIIYDLGATSYLEEITKTGLNNFRVTDYDPKNMSYAHSKGVHKYCIAKEFLDAETVLSLPKVKSHQKTAVTGALKNLVGINGDKDFLPHHRMGGTSQNGDCYPGHSYLKYWSELALDEANVRHGKRSYWYWRKLSSLLWRLSFPGPEDNLSAGWYGNDTTWRMVLDINKIALFGNLKGEISEIPQRNILSLCDGIIAGQGDGPLEPEPCPLGIITFTNNSVLNDMALAVLMGFPVEKIPLVNRILPPDTTKFKINLNGSDANIEDLMNYSIRAIPPKGWIKYFS